MRSPERCAPCIKAVSNELWRLWHNQCGITIQRNYGNHWDIATRYPVPCCCECRKGGDSE